jgi:hypothetical protein
MENKTPAAGSGRGLEMLAGDPKPVSIPHPSLRQCPCVACTTFVAIVRSWVLPKSRPQYRRRRQFASGPVGQLAPSIRGTGDGE